MSALWLCCLDLYQIKVVFELLLNWELKTANWRRWSEIPEIKLPLDEVKGMVEIKILSMIDLVFSVTLVGRLISGFNK